MGLAEISISLQRMSENGLATHMYAQVELSLIYQYLKQLNMVCEVETCRDDHRVSTRMTSG